MSNFATTPQLMGPYSRFMVDAFNEKSVISVKTGFLAFFGRAEAGGRTRFNRDAAVFDIDIIRGNKRLGALVPRGIESRPLGPTQKNTRAQKYSTFARVMPLGEEEGDIEANQLLFRQAGMTETENQSRLDKMRGLAMEHHEEHVRRFSRTFEYLAAESLLKGTMPTLIGTTATDKLFDWRRSAENLHSVPTVWTDPAADILGDIDFACNRIANYGNGNPDMIVFSSSAINAFMADADVKEKADNRRFELIEVSNNFPVPPEFASFVAGGFVARGRLRTPDGYTLWMFTANYRYDDATGTSTKYLPDGKVLVADSQARCDRYFGPPEVMPDIPQRQQQYQQLFGFSPAAPAMPENIMGMGDTITPAMFYFDAYMPNDWKSATIRTQCSPVFATVQTDAFVTLLDVTT